ncbi:TPA: hypothetical protein LS266_002777 [Escherichia coli]|nr:hypothetical protein [Escherichia coli]
MFGAVNRYRHDFQVYQSVVGAVTVNMVYAVARLNGVESVDQPDNDIVSFKEFPFTVNCYDNPIITLF